MRLILVLLLLPFIQIFGWFATPFVWLFGHSMFFVEGLRMHLGSWAEFAYIAAIITLVVYCGKSSKFFWFGLLPFLIVSALIGRW